MIKVVIVEDSEKIRLGLKMLIDGTSSYKCVGDYETCESMFEEVEKLKPDVVMMDIDLPGMSGIDGIRKLRQIFPDLRILVLTIYDESDTVFQALCAGLADIWLKKLLLPDCWKLLTKLLRAVLQCHHTLQEKL